VIVSNFIATTEGRILINANDGHSIENITLRDIKLNYPYIEDAAIYGPYATSNQFRGIDSTGMVANAAVVISNASNIAFDGLDISWPKTNLVPESWRHPERIENGKFDKVHYPEYDDYRNPAYHAVYLSNVQGGYIFAPMVTASSPPMKPIAINDSFVKLMGLKE
jgi:hypothetical protein